MTKVGPFTERNAQTGIRPLETTLEPKYIDRASSFRGQTQKTATLLTDASAVNWLSKVFRFKRQHDRGRKTI